MNQKFNVIALCGSTKFKAEYESATKYLTMNGNIVLSCPIFHHADNLSFSRGILDSLHRMHKQRIDMADEIFVININGYIGDSTKEEILYAQSQNKRITYWSTSNRTASGGCEAACMER